MARARSELLAERTHWWAVVAAACFCVLMLRLGWVQLVRHAYYADRGEKTIGRVWDWPAPRGNIVDRNGVPLALNLKLYSISADPTLINDLPRAAHRLSPVLCMPEVKLLDLLKGHKPGEPPPTKPIRFVRLREDVDEPVAKAVEALHIGGVIVRPDWKRAYPHGTVGAALLGFVGSDMVGLSGIEARLNRTLAGQPGEMFVMLDGRLPRSRTLIPGRSEIIKQMEPGESVVLTIDVTLQRIADEALATAVQAARAKGGTAVVMDPYTGEVLALASQPTFDPNQYQKSHPASWVSQAVTSPYEPGSTFKSITACAALEEGVYAHGERYNCTGARPAGNRTIHCAHGAHHAVDLHDMIVRSCNVGLGTVALELGPSRLHSWLTKLGFGARTGIELAGETEGILTSPQRWSQSQTANIGFGQGISVTPIQLVAAYATIANGGMRVKPHVVRMVMRGEQMGPIIRPQTERALSDQTCAFMRHALQGVVDDPHGTGHSARIPGRTVAGKTGTAQKPVPGIGYRSGKYVGSFVGFAPVTDPKLAVIVVIDEPSGSHYGGVVAAPAFKEIVEEGLSYLHVPLDASLSLAKSAGGSAAE